MCYLIAVGTIFLYVRLFSMLRYYRDPKITLHVNDKMDFGT